MTMYVCKGCNYRFESNIPREGKSCPYCGEPKVIREPDAEELLNEEEF